MASTMSPMKSVLQRRTHRQQQQQHAQDRPLGQNSQQRPSSLQCRQPRLRQQRDRLQQHQRQRTQLQHAIREQQMQQGTQQLQPGQTEGLPDVLHSRECKAQLELYQQKQQQQQQVKIQEQQQVEQQSRSKQHRRQRSIRWFLLESYKGPDLPVGYSLGSLAFGTSSEEEEEEQQRGAPEALISHASLVADGAEGSTLATFRLAGCSKLKKKRKERKVSVGAADALWQPHFHPHNQEFRVRYRYKGSMRLKTLSCARYGREGARRLTGAFVQRWEQSGRRIAAKTHRSKLALSDLPLDNHRLPVYDKKRSASPPFGNRASASEDARSIESNSACRRRPNNIGSGSTCNNPRSKSNVNTDSVSIIDEGDSWRNIGVSALQMRPPSSVALKPQMHGLANLTQTISSNFAIPQVASIPKMLPSTAATLAAFMKSLPVTGPAEGASAPYAAVFDVHATPGSVRSGCALGWPVPAPAFGAAKGAGRGGTGVILNQPKLDAESGDGGRLSNVLSWEDTHKLYSQNLGSTSLFVPSIYTSNNNAACSCSAKLSINSSSNGTCCPCGDQPNSSSNSSCPVRPGRTSNTCSCKNTYLLSGCCDAVNQYNTPGAKKIFA